MRPSQLIPASLALKKMIWAFASIPVIAAIFLGIVTASFAIPNSQIIDHLVERPNVLTARRANNGRVIDADSECIGISAGVFELGSENQDAVQRAVRARSLYSCGALLNWIETGDVNDHFEYFRYWHGYQAIMRPLLFLLPYNDVRGILFLLSTGLLGLLVWRLGADFGGKVGLALLLPFVFLNAMGYWVVATKAAIWLVIVGGAIFITRRNNDDVPVLAFFALGAFTAFFDFLNVPVLSLIIPLFVWVLYHGPRRDHVTVFKILGIVTAFWSLGYVGLWIGKFVISANVIGGHVWADISGSIANRLRGQSQYIDGFWPGTAILKNISALKSLWGPATIAFFVIAPLVTSVGRQNFHLVWTYWRSLIVLALVPFVWLELLSNHSQIHAAFTHLNFAPACILACLCFFDVFRNEPKFRGMD